ncbi:MAG: hypothetical protein U9R00_01365 [Patescibacteria group bacterium]|nr:hypothetical protein [Patescibacteria group bacterium]
MKKIVVILLLLSHSFFLKSQHYNCIVDTIQFNDFCVMEASCVFPFFSKEKVDKIVEVKEFCFKSLSFAVALDSSIHIEYKDIFLKINKEGNLVNCYWAENDFFTDDISYCLNEECLIKFCEEQDFWTIRCLRRKINKILKRKL